MEEQPFGQLDHLTINLLCEETMKAEMKKMHMGTKPVRVGRQRGSDVEKLQCKVDELNQEQSGCNLFSDERRPGGRKAFTLPSLQRADRDRRTNRF